MRLRKKAWARPELESSHLFIKDPKKLKGCWREAFKNDNPIHLELGCGKGYFVCKHGESHRDINYVAIDIKDEILVYAKRNIEKEYKDANVEACDINNVFITALEIAFIEDVFEKDEISHIYINFCNPWPKERHKKRRLTHPQFLERYKKFIKEGTEIWFKTDDDDLFLESQEYFTNSGFVISYITYDLHNTNFKGNVVTEHEEMFTEKGIKTKFLIAKLDNNKL